jgi:P4 family phage/plasmid primase-like protien
LIEWALRYIKLGWAVLPLNGKVPLVKNGSKDATFNESQARAWWKQWPQANIGVATGQRFFAVDVDVKKGGDETWDMLRAQHGALPDTAEQITGTGGRHLLYLLPDFTVHNSEEKIGPGIDIRGAGGYIVVAPSIHPQTKKRYAWDGLAEIEQQQLAAAPAWLLKLLQEATKRPAAAALPDRITQGTRDTTLFRIGCGLRRRGWTADEIFASLAVINKTRCEPPLDDRIVRQKADSAARYQPDRKASEFKPSDEVALGQADVEAAVEDAIARNDLLAAVELAPHVAKLRTSVQALIQAKLKIKFKGEFPAKEFERAVRGDTVKAGAGKVVQMPPPADGDPPATPLGPDLMSYPLTDSGNGERIVTLFGPDLRYCIEMQKWLVWDGCRWAIDDRNAVTQKAKQMARLLHAQAVNYPVISKWARTSESQAGIAAALKRASSEAGIPIAAAELDQHLYLLNCTNGVVDLRTGDLLPHDRAYFITKLCHVTFDLQAACPRFLKFLHWAMGDNPEADITSKTVRLVAFLQRAFGYALTGDVSEKAAFVFWGPKGNNGKTTLLTAMRMLFPEYSAQISIDTLMTQRGGADAALRADLADLRGARLVTTSEVEKEHRLSEGKLKYITAGMGKIKSCRKYENPIEFEATHKLFMDCNHRPAVRGTDDAIWRRLKPVPFEVSIEESDPEFDKKLLEKLQAEAAGILAWGVRGCQAWLAEGLGDPPEISAANSAWREHDDPLKEFLEDCCLLGDEYFVRTSELTAAYIWWCKQNHERFPLGREAFQERMQSKGYRYNRSRRSGDDKQMRTWEWVGLKEEIREQVAASDSGYRGKSLHEQF